MSQVTNRVAGIAQLDDGRVIGSTVLLPFDAVTSAGAGVALTTIQGTPLAVPRRHRVRAVHVQASTLTAVTAGTDPSIDVYRHLPVPAALTGALAATPIAGNVEDGAHLYAAVFYNAAGSTTPSATISVTVADKTVNGKVELVLPIGPTGTTGRKLYRTEAAGTALKLLDTVANNTATTYTDNIADASLGAAVPAANTAAATILSATLKLTVAGSDRVLTDQPLQGALAADPSESDACVYTLRVLTGASTGAIGKVKAALEVEFLD